VPTTASTISLRAVLICSPSSSSILFSAFCLSKSSLFSFLLSEVHPVADLCSHFRDPEPTTPYG
jgi:hypothetical protein